MKLHPHHVILLSTVIVVAVIGGATLIDAKSTRDSEMQRATLTRKRDFVDKEAEHLTVRLASAEEDRKANELALDGLAKPKANTPAVVAAKPSISKTKEELAHELSTVIVAEESRQKEPKAQNQFLEMLRAKLRVTYAPFFRTLGISGEQIAQFEAIAARRDEQQFDLGALLRAGKLSLQDPNAGKLWTQVDLDFTAGAKAVLGEAGFQQLQDFERTLPAREIVRSMAGEAAVYGQPLTADQAERMTRILAEASADYRRGAKASSNFIEWDRVDAQAREVLSAVQWSWFTNDYAGRFSNQFDALANRAQRKDQAIAPTQQ